MLKSITVANYEYYYNMGKIVGAMIESIAKMIPNESLEGDEAIITPKGNDPGQSNWTEKRIQGKALRLLIGDIEASLNNEIQLKALEVLREQQIETRGKDKSGKTVHFTYDVIGNSYYVTELLKAAKDLGKASR